MREKLIELLSRYFTIGDSYSYNLTRIKTAFAVGTMSLDDFEEFDDDTVADIADYLIANGVTIPVRCKDCKHYVIRALACRNEHMNGVIHMNGFCSYGERRTDV